uniref:Immunoglobulin subtype domain-containing protein n=1 Tax=Dicentrarchus labrax TaxID=13489 RepID=A0A8C4ECF0_DICLA
MSLEGVVPLLPSPQLFAVKCNASRQQFNLESNHYSCGKKFGSCALQADTKSIKQFKTVKIEGPLTDRAKFYINNGTLKITNVERNDSGLYTVDVFNSDGVRVQNININLDCQGKCFEIESSSSNLFTPLYSCIILYS